MRPHGFLDRSPAIFEATLGCGNARWLAALRRFGRSRRALVHRWLARRWLGARSSRFKQRRLLHAVSRAVLLGICCPCRNHSNAYVSQSRPRPNAAGRHPARLRGNARRSRGLRDRRRTRHAVAYCVRRRTGYRGTLQPDASAACRRHRRHSLRPHSRGHPAPIAGIVSHAVAGARLARALRNARELLLFVGVRYWGGCCALSAMP